MLETIAANLESSNCWKHNKSNLSIKPPSSWLEDMIIKYGSGFKQKTKSG
jgi:hypothetical protein